MVKRSAKPASSAVSNEPKESLMSAKLHVTLTTLLAGKMLHRVHLKKYKAGQFNPGKQGNARFSPIQNGQGQFIPTLYAGTTIPCAMMETIFHDVPHAPGFKNFDKHKLVDQAHSVVEVTQDLQLVDLGSVALRKLGIPRNQLIDTEKDQYPVTRKWAETVHIQCTNAQGLSWVSRQDDSARAFVLFGDRIPGGLLQQQGSSRCLLNDVVAYGEVLDLAERIGVSVVAGKN